MLPKARRVRRIVAFTLLALACCLLAERGVLRGAEEALPKPSPDNVLKMLKAGNERFAAGKAESPHSDTARLKRAGSASQADYAYATVLSCSDSRVPVERIFDAGVMDIFVVRVAGNVCNTDEIGSIEYGLAHVRTPVLVILGHTQCGAVTAVTEYLQGHGHALERNIPPLIKSIEPAVKRAMQKNPNLTGPELVNEGIECNVWTGIENLFRASPAVRELASQGTVKVVGAIYDVGTGRINWLPENTVYRLLGRVEMDPSRATQALAQASHTAHQGDPQPVPHHPPVAKHVETETHPTPAPTQAEPAHAEKGEGESIVAHAGAQAPAGRPWGLIALCGIVFVLGLGVALAAQFMPKKPNAKSASAPAPATQTASAMAKPPAA